MKENHNNIGINIESEEYIARIKFNYQKLSNSGKKIADFILKERKNICNYSVQSIAEIIHTSPATIVRFCNTIGYSGYAQLKFYIQNGSNIPEETDEIKIGDDIKTIKKKLISFNKVIIDDALTRIDDSEIEKVVDALINAERIFVYSEGGSGSVAFALSSVLTHIGLNCVSYSDAFMQITSACHLKSGDVAIGISHTGKARNTIEAIKTAHNAGAFTAFISAGNLGNYMEYVDAFLPISFKSSLATSDLPAARISELCVVSIIQLGIMAKDNKRFSDNFQKSKEALKIKRLD
ncbi:MAG: MurR/RpiR family transcriptional regulator [Lachnospiraceae bacterium]|nr:MurR/RpiR family transcriptional regulator [Lachnospiraceae bacterium]